jgi:hypothetical protein
MALIEDEVGALPQLSSVWIRLKVSMNATRQLQCARCLATLL